MRVCLSRFPAQASCRAWTSFRIASVLCLAVIGGASALADLPWPSDMAAQVAAVAAAALPAGGNATPGSADAFDTWGFDEDVSAGIAFSTMPGGTVLVMR